MKIIRILKMIVFLALITAGGISTIIFSEKKVSDLENRELAVMPKFKTSDIFSGKFQRDYETFLSDQFMARDLFVSVALNLQSDLGIKRVNGVYLGANDYLIEGQKKLTKDDKVQVQANISILTSFLNAMVNKYGENYVKCMMIPSKYDVLSDKLPSYSPRSKYTKKTIAGIRKDLNSPDILIDLNDVLSQHTGEYIYYRTDHHWTSLGAFYAYNKYLVESGVNEGNNKLSDYNRRIVFDDFYGTTYNKAHVNVQKDLVEVFELKKQNGLSDSITVTFDEKETSNSLYFHDEALKGFNRYNYFLSKNTFKIDIKKISKKPIRDKKEKNSKKRTLLLIKDSFANCFVPFLLNEFDRIIMIDYRYGKESIGSILETNADISNILVLYNTEKFMENTKLLKLADLKEENNSVEEFDIQDFL